MAEESSDANVLGYATELTIAWLSNPNTRASADDVPTFLQNMHGAVTNLAARTSEGEATASEPEYVPAVSVRRSLASKEHIVSMIDGKPYKTLKRHLAGHGLTPAQYRERYGLKPDYPMVAENYAAMRRDIAKKLGLGRKPTNKAAASKAEVAPKAEAPPKAPKAKAAPRKPKKSDAAPAEASSES